MIDDNTVKGIINQLNSAQRKYSNDREHFAWQQGLLIGVLAWAMKNDSIVKDHFNNAIRLHNKSVEQADNTDMFAALDKALNKK